MAAGHDTRHLSNISLARGPLAALLAATLLGGAMIGAAITAQSRPTDTTRAAIPVPVQPAATFDAVRFRAEEHGALVPQPNPGAISSERRDRLGGP
jgi:hypothetical protein